MLIVLEEVLGHEAVAELVELLGRVDFDDGRKTAGWAATLVKRNAQAAPDPAVEQWRERVAGALMAGPIFNLAAQPKHLVGPLFSRYTPGDAYGDHVDEPLMDGVRTDLSFTLFLSDPAGYDGGELVIESPAGSEAHKHPPGTLVLYPSTSIHRVSPVRRGVRLAAVGWVRSFVRDPAERELLFDLETARRRLFESHGKTHEVDLLSKCYANLLRRWMDD